MRVGIALGSNLGDRRAHLCRAKEQLLGLHQGEAPALVSSLYETDPVDCEPGTQPFLNAIIEIGTTLGPVDLLDLTQRMESEAGRPSVREKNSPRPLDLDLLYAGDLAIQTDRLEIPHPRLCERRFVLNPLAEIRPDLVLPGKTETIAALAEMLVSDEAVPIKLPEKW